MKKPNLTVKTSNPVRPELKAAFDKGVKATPTYRTGSMYVTSQNDKTTGGVQPV